MAAPSPTNSLLVIPPGATPVAEGTLAGTPLLHLYVYLLDKALTGTLVLRTSSGKLGAVYTHEGAPGRAMSFEGTLAADRAKLESVVVELCLAPPETKYAFYVEHDGLAAASKQSIPRVEPLAVIMAAARQCVSASYAEAALRKVAGVASIGLAIGATPERFRLAPEERALVERLRKQRSSLVELAKATGVPERIVRAVIYGMTITRHLDFGMVARAPVGTDRPPPSTVRAPEPSAWSPSTGTTGIQYVDQTGPLPPTEKKPEQPSPPPPRASSDPGVTQTLANERRRAEIEMKLAAYITEDHFQILGVSRSATSADVRTAYFGLAKIFHPDKLSKDLHDLKPRVQVLFAKINAAYEELSEDGRRASYLASLNAPAEPSPDSVSRVVNAVLEAQKAEALLRKNDLTGAEFFAKRAVSADPENPTYKTILVWIRAEQRPMPPLEEGKTNAVYDELIAELDAVLKKEPDYERAIFYRGMLLKRSGRMEKAIRDFKRAAELKPSNIDAAREVRLYEMRQGNKPSNDGGGGLFDKLFKRKEEEPPKRR